ncbi:MAG TPA: hypothetical protein VE998_11380, partial [Terriglobales bacterium]|nr:hypothetical protein [Terriglobales bacterium]
MTSRFRVLVGLSALLLVSGAVAAQSWTPAGPYNGQWLIERSGDAGRIRLQMRYHYEDWNGNSSMSWSRDVAASDIQGLTPEQLNQPGNVKFTIKRDAGNFACEGYASNGEASGHFTFQPNQAFAQQLASKGIGQPTD